MGQWSYNIGGVKVLHKKNAGCPRSIINEKVLLNIYLCRCWGSDYFWGSGLNAISALNNSALSIELFEVFQHYSLLLCQPSGYERETPRIQLNLPPPV